MFYKEDRTRQFTEEAILFKTFIIKKINKFINISFPPFPCCIDYNFKYTFQSTDQPSSFETRKMKKILIISLASLIVKGILS